MNKINQEELCECTFTEEEMRNSIGFPEESIEMSSGKRRKVSFDSEAEKQDYADLMAVREWVKSIPKGKLVIKHDSVSRRERRVNATRLRQEAFLKRKKERSNKAEIFKKQSWIQNLQKLCLAHDNSLKLSLAPDLLGISYVSLYKFFRSGKHEGVFEWEKVGDSYFIKSIPATPQTKQDMKKGETE